MLYNILKDQWQMIEIDRIRSITQETAFSQMAELLYVITTTHSKCCRTRTKDAINPMTTQRTQHKKQKPHRGNVSTHVWQAHRLALQTIVIQMGFYRAHTQEQHRLIISN